MKLIDYFGFIMFVSFGFWFLAFPSSFISFYTWFHRGSVRMPKASGVRIVGALWILLMTVVMWTFFRSRGI
jgi:hypothetical protein